MKLFKLILVAPDLLLYKAFQKYFANFPDVEIVNDYFQWITGRWSLSNVLHKITVRSC